MSQWDSMHNVALENWSSLSWGCAPQTEKTDFFYFTAAAAASCETFHWSHVRWCPGLPVLACKHMQYAHFRPHRLWYIFKIAEWNSMENEFPWRQDSMEKNVQRKARFHEGNSMKLVFHENIFHGWQNSMEKHKSMEKKVPWKTKLQWKWSFMENWVVYEIKFHEQYSSVENKVLWKIKFQFQFQ